MKNRTLKIELEGTDGSSKSTSLKYLISKAQERGLSVVETREVGNPHIPACVKMRELVLDPQSDLRGESMEMIFSAMRYENDKWLNNLKISKNVPDLVISDRGLLSHLAYTDHNVSEEFTTMFYGDVVSETTNLPDIVIYFDINTETALKRRVRRGETMDAIEIKGVPFQEKVRNSFEKYLQIYAKSFDIYRVDANKTLLEVQMRLDDILDSIIDINNTKKRLRLVK